MDSSFNAFQIFQSGVEKLSNTYEKEEAAANVRWLMEDLLGLSRINAAMHKSYAGTPESLHQFEEALDRVMQGTPVQYVLGYAEFLQVRYEVNPAVLIPRPETEELVLQIIKDNPQARTILDIGTGSGCIAISLAKGIPEAEVSAWDVEAGALQVASSNAKRLKVNVRFEKVNVLEQWPEQIGISNQLDLIVSNPPYIREQEKKDMRTNVLAHEPEVALFVPDEDALLFYREIATKGSHYLNSGGKLYFEINESFGKEVVELLIGLGYDQVELQTDFQDKPRMVSGRWPG